MDDSFGSDRTLQMHGPIETTEFIISKTNECRKSVFFIELNLNGDFQFKMKIFFVISIIISFFQLPEFKRIHFKNYKKNFIKFFQKKSFQKRVKMKEEREKKAI